MTELSVFEKKFWDLVLQKLVRNLASVKYQWLLLLYIPTIHGMFTIKPGTNDSWVSATVGFTLLGGGFITLALGRIIANTNLVDKSDTDFNTDK